jgi:dihydroflavonol-4-reductase
MTTLVTGTTGFVGAAVLRKALAAGHEARALVRPGSDRRNLEGLRVEVVPGDLTDRASVEAAVRGCDVVFHVAADYRLWVVNSAPMYAANVEGTRNVMLAAAEAGAQRIVHTSSVATLGYTHDGSPADEDTASTLSDMIGHYKRSKYMAEKEVVRLVRDVGLPAIIVNPSTPVGPRDVKPTPTGKMIVNAASGRMPAYVETGLNVVHADDVADGHLLALQQGRIGERYILGSEDMSLREILTAVAHITGGRPPRVSLPHGLVFPIAFLMEAWARLTGGEEPMVTTDGVRLSRKRMFFSSAKAVRELGYAPRPAHAAIEEAIAWFRENGYLGRRRPPPRTR